MREKNVDRFSPDWKLIVAIIALLVAVFVALYGTGQCQQVSHPSWITPLLNLVCTKPTPKSSTPSGNTSPVATISNPNNTQLIFVSETPPSPLMPTVLSRNAWIIAEGGEDLLQLAGWSGCGDFEGGEFTIRSSQKNYCGIHNGRIHLDAKVAWGIRVVLEVGPQRNLDNMLSFVNASSLGQDFKEIGVGLTPSQLRVMLGTNEGPYFNNSFDAPLIDGPNEVEVYSIENRFEFYVNGRKVGDIPDLKSTFDNGKVYFGAYIGPPQGDFTIHSLSALVPADQPNNVTVVSP